MRRRLALPLILLSPLALNACGFVVMHTARKLYKDGTQQEAAVELALARYREAVLRGDAEQAAAFYTDDAQLSPGEAAPLRGRSAIQAFLMMPEGARLSEYELKAAATDVDGDRATQKGSYRQKTVMPQGRTVEAKGHFDAVWARQAGGRWLLARLHTAESA